MTTDLKSWIGRTQTRQDRLDRARVRVLEAALGETVLSDDGDELPLLFHWLYFWDETRPDEIGPDGHLRRGEFIPSIEAPRRMWAGGRLHFERPLRIGDTTTRTSVITAVEVKDGRTGPLTFVTIRHSIATENGPAVEEDQTLVFRGGAAVPAGVGTPPADDRPDWAVTIDTDSVLLFRYSALTMNSHRIHYDRDYATGVEGYPGLVVHGPLQAVLMLRAAQRGLTQPILTFHYRGVAPAFAGQPVVAAGRRTEQGAQLWIEQDGRRTMTGTLTHR